MTFVDDEMVVISVGLSSSRTDTLRSAVESYGGDFRVVEVPSVCAFMNDEDHKGDNRVLICLLEDIDAIREALGENYSIATVACVDSTESVAHLRALSAGAAESVDLSRDEPKDIVHALIGASVRERRNARAGAVNERLRRFMSEKDTLLVSVSRELRDPLNSIIGFAQIIEDQIFGSSSGEPYAEYGADIRSGAHRMLNVIEELGDLNLIQSEEPGLDPTPTSVADVLMSERHSAISRHASKEDALELLPVEGVRLLVDERLLRRLVRWLFDYALLSHEGSESCVIDGVETDDGWELVLREAAGGAVPAARIDLQGNVAAQVTRQLARSVGGEVVLGLEEADVVAKLVFPAERVAA